MKTHLNNNNNNNGKMKINEIIITKISKYNDKVYHNKNPLDRKKSLTNLIRKFSKCRSDGHSIG